MNGTIITNKGLQLIAKLVASGTELAFTRAAIGIGSVPQGYDPGSMIGLNQYIMDGMISSCSASGDEASIVFQISSIGVVEGFTMTEAGLFAQDPDEGEILYAYLDMASDPQYIYPENNAISKFVEFTLVVKVGRVSSITAYINPSALVTREELDEELKKKVDITGGDVANTKVSEFSTETASFPVPAAGDTTKTLWGKIKKFAEDFRNWYTGVCLIGSIVNNCTSTATDKPLAAAQGKVVWDKIVETVAALTTHKSSGDHDGRYYTESEMDTKLAGKSDTSHGHSGMLTTGSIVNNCTSTASNLPLAAAQGKVLMDLYTQLNSDIEKRNADYDFIRGTVTCNGAEKSMKSYTPASGIWLIVINGQLLSNSDTRAYITCYINEDERNVLTADISSSQYHSNGTASVHVFDGKQTMRFATCAANGVNMRYNIGFICLKKA